MVGTKTKQQQQWPNLSQVIAGEVYGVANFLVEGLEHRSKAPGYIHRLHLLDRFLGNEEGRCLKHAARAKTRKIFTDVLQL